MEQGQPGFTVVTSRSVEGHAGLMSISSYTSVILSTEDNMYFKAFVKTGICEPNHLHTKSVGYL